MLAGLVMPLQAYIIHSSRTTTTSIRCSMVCEFSSRYATLYPYQNPCQQQLICLSCPDKAADLKKVTCLTLISGLQKRHIHEIVNSFVAH